MEEQDWWLPKSEQWWFYGLSGRLFCGLTDLAECLLVEGSWLMVLMGSGLQVPGVWCFAINSCMLRSLLYSLFWLFFWFILFQCCFVCCLSFIALVSFCFLLTSAAFEYRARRLVHWSASMSFLLWLFSFVLLKAVCAFSRVVCMEWDSVICQVSESERAGLLPFPFEYLMRFTSMQSIWFHTKLPSCSQQLPNSGDQPQWFRPLTLITTGKELDTSLAPASNRHYKRALEPDFDCLHEAGHLES